MFDISYTQNRELSWLKFNERVLNEAQNASTPLLERGKFLSIFDTNLDEFFMVRVGSLTDVSHLKKDVIDNKSLMTPEEQLDRIMEETRFLYQKKDHIYGELREKFRTIGICSTEVGELTEQERLDVDIYFHKKVLPILNYQVIDKTHPLPQIPNLGMFLLFVLREKGKSINKKMGIVQIPDQLRRYYFIGDQNFIFLEKMIAEFAESLFGSYIIEDWYNVSLTRNADIDFDEVDDLELEEDYRSHMKKLLQKRKRLAPVRVEVHKRPTEEVKSFLMKQFSLKENRIFETYSPMRLGFLMDAMEEFPEKIRNRHSNPPFSPRKNPNVSMNRPIMEQIEEKDILLSYPYESMEPILRLLEEAAEDKEVYSIKISLYRIAKNSKIAAALIQAAENGKEVIVLMELRARFDEENNLLWSSRLEKAGCKIIYGFSHYKCHCKTLLITKKKGEGWEYVSQVATGNFNEKTANLYTDFALLTANQEIGEDIDNLFRNFSIDELNGTYKKLLVSPKSMQEGLDKLFNEEIQKAKAGEEGFIRLKMNSISDRKLIDKIAEASQAGVKIEMLIRGICCIVPGVVGKTDNVKVYSIIGRFLEHHRIYQFGKGEEAQVFISSADFMTRNIRNRVEVACPVLDSDRKKEVMEFLEDSFSDDVKLQELLPSKRYGRVENKRNFIAQEYFMKQAIAKDPQEEKESFPKRPSLLRRIIQFFSRS
ncbi:polyphosphate kinase 1 [Peptoniphilus sp. KCTC 25270]|uniref:polyphosphate kinase 1 n=1 Tax=Peptoniphilus sp. KCTC 25270 TaxID=2897414 RepID=UPI001E393F72|nr:polyphosphate kinase 1 [Peptoniphilus sp. KCTC 25270]MCD1147429.1 polyphosphate kinase 1 [Peptoniphilus sp. KCTC 25270]